VIASAEELVYDQNWNLKYRIEGSRIYDKNWQLKGHIQDGKIFDKNWRLKCEGPIDTSPLSVYGLRL